MRSPEGSPAITLLNELQAVYRRGRNGAIAGERKSDSEMGSACAAHACRMFLRSRRRIADVAVASGFHDQAHMVREWHALAGSSPREWILGQLPFLQDYPGAMSIPLVRVILGALLLEVVLLVPIAPPSFVNMMLFLTGVRV